MDERDALLLTTAYETMNSLERFSFAGPNVRLRTSTVEGLSNTASFCIETRIDAAAGSGGGSVRESAAVPAGSHGTARPGESVSLLGW
jgi:hypothetical protein